MNILLQCPGQWHCSHRSVWGR